MRPAFIKCASITCVDLFGLNSLTFFDMVGRGGGEA